MAQEVYRLADVNGLTPAVDPTRSGEQYVLNGSNYLFDAIGPKSAFGNRLLLAQPLPDSDHIQAIRLKLRSGDRVFTFTSKAILEWREDTGGWRTIYVTPDTTNQPYRWTFGFLSEVMYFCHPLTGIIAYGLYEDYAAALTTEGSPTDALAITVDNGRLVAVTPEYLFWSAPSNGADFRPSLGGAGFQLLAARVPGYPVMVTSYARGVLTWTTGGVLRSEFSGDQEVYRHRALNTEYRPMNSFCIFKQDDNTVILLDERGFFQSQGEAPTPWMPIFNEFLINYLQDNDLRLGDVNVRLEWDELQRHLYLSTSQSRYSPLYEQCFVLYPPTQKWGQFSEEHYGILPVRINSGSREDDYYGFVGADRRLRQWKAVGSREVVEPTLDSNLFYPLIQKPFHYAGGDEGTVVSSSMIVNTIPTSEMKGRAGYYPSDGITTVLPPVLEPLNAFVQIGLFRSSRDMSHDEMSELIQIFVRSNQSGAKERTGVDFSLIPPPSFDFNQPDEGRYYGFEELNYVNHQLTIYPTNDAVTVFGDPVIPSLEGFTKGARHYSCSAVGIWHIIEIRAGELGQAFHLRTLEITGTSAGRLL